MTSRKWGLAAFVIMFLAGNAALAVAQDTTPPQLTAFDFNPKTINTTSAPVTVTVTFTVTDDMSGVAYVETSFLDASGVMVASGSKHVAVGASVSDSFTITFPKGSIPGTYTIGGVYLMDAAGNTVVLPPTSLSAFPTTLNVTSTPDTTAPVLTALSFAGPVNATSSPASLTVNFSATDNASGVTSFQIAFKSPSGTFLQQGTATVAAATSVSGSATVTFPQSTEGGTWTVVAVQVGDAAGNTLNLSTSDLTGLSFPTALTVTSPADTVAPILATMSFAPPTIDVSSTPAVVTATYSATDNLSGVKTFLVSFKSPSGTQVVRGSFTITPATTANGSFPITFPALSEAGVWPVASVIVTDAAGNSTSGAVVASVTVTSTPDTTVPALTAFNFTPATINTSALPRQVAVTFSATDNLSGVKAIEAAFISPSGAIVKMATSSFTRSTSVSGSAMLNFARNIEAGAWTVASVLITDAAGNQKLLTTSDLTTLTLPTTLTVSNAPQPPTATSQPQSFTFPGPSTFALNVSDPNSLALTYHQTAAPANGTVSVVCTTTCNATYTPNVGTGGPDSFNYFVSNPNGLTSSTVMVSITVNPASQNITFAGLPGKTFGDAPFGVSALASSGLTVSFSSTTTAVCTVSGSTVTIVAAGGCSVKASQAGNPSYSAALDVIQSFSVGPASQTINFGPLSGKTFGNAPFTVSANATSTLAVTFSSSSTPVCTVSGSTVTIVAAGTCTIVASQTGSANFNAAADVMQSFTVAQASQTINFGVLGVKTFGDAAFTVGANATSMLAVTFASTTPAVCTVSGTSVTITGGGSCTITASQAGNTNFSAAPDVMQSFTVNQASQTIAFGVLGGKTFGDAAFSVSAMATSPLAVIFSSTTAPVCTVSGPTVTIVAAGGCTIKASQPGNASYSAALDVMQSFTVAKAAQAISFAALGAKTFGDAAFTVSATAGPSLAVTFASTTTPVCTVAGSTVTIIAAGTCTITASQAGNANYNAAMDVMQSFTVNPAGQTISFGALSGKQVTDAPFTVSATATSGLTVTFASTTGPVCTIVGSTVTIVAPGTCSITASQSGNGNYNAAPDVMQSFSVGKLTQTIMFTALAAKTYGNAPFALGATSTSMLGVTFASTTMGVCTVSGSTVTILAAGSCSITASQAGSATYNVATDVPQTFTVGKAPLTVTVQNAGAPVGAPLPAFSAVIIGFVNGDTAAVVSGSPVIIGPPPGSPAGVYPVTATVGSLAAANYAFANFANGTLTIVPTSTEIALSNLMPGITAAAGQSFTFTYSVLGAINAPVPTGSLFYTVDTGARLSAAIANGAATVTLAGLPLGAHSVSVNYGGDANYNASAVQTLTLTVAPPPTVNTGGVVGSAGFTVNLSPGGLGTIFGTNLAGQTVNASTLPLPLTLGGVRVLLNNRPAPLNYVSPTQINFQVPFETPAGSTVTVVIVRDGVPGPGITVTIAASAPSIFTYQRTPTSIDPVILHVDNTLVTPTSPAKAGEILVIYATGSPRLNNAPASGAPAPFPPNLATTIDTPVITVGGAGAIVSYSGLTPGFVGLLQINIQLPATLPAGLGNPPSLPLIVTLAGAASPTVGLWVSQ